MPQAKPKWEQSNYFLLDAVQYRPETATIWMRFQNKDSRQVTTATLWGDRPGQPDWPKITIDPDGAEALLVPTLPGSPTLEGVTAEIPSDVLRAHTDVDYRAYVSRRAARWAKQTGRQLRALREARGLTQQAVALAVGLEVEKLAEMEAGRVDFSLATVDRILTALGATLDQLPEMKAD